MTLLNDIFAQQFSRDGLMGWLADKDIFSFEDARLVEALNERLCDSIPEEPLDQKIKASQDCPTDRSCRPSTTSGPETCPVSLCWDFRECWDSST